MVSHLSDVAVVSDILLAKFKSLDSFFSQNR